MTAPEIKALRVRLSLTQQALAERLGVSTMTIKSWECGRFAPRGRRVQQLLALEGPAPTTTTPAAPPPPAAPAPAPAQTLSSVYSAPPAPASGDREVIRLGEAVRRMGLQDDGRGKRRSDRTIRNAIKAGRLYAWKAPGYRVAIAEWCFYGDDFEQWRAKHYHAYRDPRPHQETAAPVAEKVKFPPRPEVKFSPAPRLRKRK